MTVIHDRRAVSADGAPTVHAVLLDFGGTLDADGVTWKERMHRLWRDEGLEVPPAVFETVFHAADDALVGTIPAHATLAETVERLAAGVARGLGVHGDSRTGRVAARFVTDSRAVLERNRAVLAALSPRYRLGLVSNFYGNLAAVCAETGLTPLLSAIADSTCVGCTKPDPRVFRAALDELGVEPARALFVGDSLPRDMAGARALGMPHAWVTAPTAAPRQACCPSDPVLTSLADLAGLLS
jgi:putative hydrolase of the HAD superfamily